MKDNREEKPFKEAFYVSKGTGHSGLMVTSLILGFFAILIIIIMNAEKWPIAKTGTIISSVALAAFASLFTVALIRNEIVYKKVVFAVFETYLIIYAKNDTGKYSRIKIYYAEIRECEFEPEVTYDSDDSARLFPHVRNYGDLKISTQKQTYKVQIRDIESANKWLSKYVEGIRILSK